MTVEGLMRPVLRTHTDVENVDTMPQQTGKPLQVRADFY